MDGPFLWPKDHGCLYQWLEKKPVTTRGWWCHIHLTFKTVLFPAPIFCIIIRVLYWFSNFSFPKIWIFFASWGVTKFLGNRIFIAVSGTDFGKSRWLVIVGYPFLLRHCERKIWLCMRILLPCSYVNSFFLGGGEDLFSFLLWCWNDLRCQWESTGEGNILKINSLNSEI